MTDDGGRGRQVDDLIGGWRVIVGHAVSHAFSRRFPEMMICGPSINMETRPETDTDIRCDECVARVVLQSGRQVDDLTWKVSTRATEAVAHLVRTRQLGHETMQMTLCWRLMPESRESVDADLLCPACVQSAARIFRRPVTDAESGTGTLRRIESRMPWPKRSGGSLSASGTA